MCWKVDFIDDRDITGYAIGRMSKIKVAVRE